MKTINDVCEICNFKKRPALTVRGVKICHECLQYLIYLSKLNNRTWPEEVEHQTKYIVAQQIAHNH